MSEIKCPKCHTVFTIDEADYNSIAKQIRDNEFNNIYTIYPIISEENDLT